MVPPPPRKEPLLGGFGRRRVAGRFGCVKEKGRITLGTVPTPTVAVPVAAAAAVATAATAAAIAVGAAAAAAVLVAVAAGSADVVRVVFGLVQMRETSRREFQTRCRGGCVSPVV